MKPHFAVKVTQNSNASQEKRKFMNSRPLFYGFLALLFGLTLSRLLFAGEILYIVLTCVALAAVIITLSCFKKFKSMIAIVLLFFVGCGLFYAGSACFVGNNYSGTNAVVARVSDDITRYDEGWSVKLDNVTINGKNEGDILVYIQDYNASLEIQVGDTIAFEAEIENVHLFKLGQFQSYYYRKNTPYSSTISASDVIITSHGQVRYDESIRQRIKSMLDNNMSEQNANICYAVLFGDKSGMSQTTRDLYQNVGIIHLLTVSGLHIGFLVGLLYFLLKKCNKYVRFCLIFAVLLAYNILCGFSPSVVRASIMALVMPAAKLSGKEYDSLSALSFASLLIVLFKPLTALDSGFLMSYFSVASIILLYRPLSDSFGKFLPNFVARGVAVTLSAQIGILPFVASYFSNLNLLSIFTNMIIIPMFSFVFPLIFVLFILTLIMPFLGVLYTAVQWIFVALNYIANLFAVGGIFISLKPMPLVLSILLFVAMFAVSRFFMTKWAWKILMCVSLILTSCITIIVYDNASVGKNTLLYIDTSPNSIVYVVNSAGQSLLLCENIEKASLEQTAYLCSIKNIDYVISLSDDEGQGNSYFSSSQFACPTRLETQDATYSISGEQKCEFGEYSFNFEYIEQRLVGITLKINNFQNFFAINDNLSYNTREELSNQINSNDYKACFLNRLKGLELDKQIMTYSTFSSGGGTYSLQKYGNIEIKFEKFWQQRCID